MELHKELGYGGAERLYQAAARQLREADTAFRPTELRRLAKDVASKSKEKDLFHKQTYGGKVARLSEGTWQADVIDMTPQGSREKNRGLRFVFTAIDIFTRKGFLRALQDQTVEEIRRALAALRGGGRTVKSVETDAGTYFTDPRTRQYLDNHDIALKIRPVRGGVQDLAVADRFVQEIRSRIAKKMGGPGVWHSQLAPVLAAYNNKSVHSAVSAPPQKVAEADEDDYLTHLVHARNSAKLAKNELEYAKQTKNIRLGDNILAPEKPVSYTHLTLPTKA